MANTQATQAAIDQLDANLKDMLDRLTAAMNAHAERLRETARDLRSGKMHPAHAANRLEKMARELFGEEA